jgi:hypothetical protein
MAKREILGLVIEQLEERIAPGVVHDGHLNSGRGNGSDSGDPNPEGDPGNSGGHNHGGD